jgi:hypothetical protein
MPVRTCVDQVSDRDFWIARRHHPRRQFAPGDYRHIRWQISHIRQSEQEKAWLAAGIDTPGTCRSRRTISEFKSQADFVRAYHFGRDSFARMPCANCPSCQLAASRRVLPKTPNQIDHSRVSHPREGFAIVTNVGRGMRGRVLIDPLHPAQACPCAPQPPKWTLEPLAGRSARPKGSHDLRVLDCER